MPTACNGVTVNAVSHKHARMYVIGNGEKYILYDCLWHDSFPVIKSGLKELGVSFAQIAGFFVSHFHPDHAGSFELLRNHGVAPITLDWQIPFAEWLNKFFMNPKNDPEKKYCPIETGSISPVSSEAAEKILVSCGICGKILRTPGHSGDGLSLVVGGAAFVGDMPRYETAGGFGGQVEASWRKIMDCGVEKIYYAHYNSELNV